MAAEEHEVDLVRLKEIKSDLDRVAASLITTNDRNSLGLSTLIEEMKAMIDIAIGLKENHTATSSNIDDIVKLKGLESSISLFVKNLLFQLEGHKKNVQ